MRARFDVFFVGSVLQLHVTHAFLPATPLTTVSSRATQPDTTSYDVPQQQPAIAPKSSLHNSAEQHESERETTTTNDASDDKKCSSSPNNTFLEEAALRGAAKIKALSIEERTKRAMLAEAVEDQMTILEDELEDLLGEDGMPRNVESREDVEALARQIKGLREQYQLLVSGAGSLTVELFDDAQNSSDDEFGVLQ